MTLKELAKNIKADIPAVFIALKDQNTPIIAKIFAGITVGYELSPIDLIPDFYSCAGIFRRYYYFTRVGYGDN